MFHLNPVYRLQRQLRCGNCQGVCAQPMADVNVTYLKLLPLWVKLDGNNSHFLSEDSLPQPP